MVCPPPPCCSYAHTSIEWQLRTLADIAFMLQSYELAFQSYHTVKKDFQGASAWFYYAGAMVGGGDTYSIVLVPAHVFMFMS